MSFLRKLFGAEKRELAHDIIGVPWNSASNDPADRDADIQSALGFLNSAEAGDPKAQAIVSVFFADGRGAPQDDSEAYKWAHLAASKGIQKAKLVLEFVTRRMTHAQILEGKKRAAEWVPEK